MLSSDLHFDDHVPLVDACINRLQERPPPKMIEVF
jgi:hypothetical protein